jgi:hypothetical protein
MLFVSRVIFPICSKQASTRNAGIHVDIIIELDTYLLIVGSAVPCYSKLVELGRAIRWHYEPEYNTYKMFGGHRSLVEMS